jgi:dTDP-4-amino-4,6-dideoxygalactose transaminase
VARSSATTRRPSSRIDQLKNFGFVDETTVVAPGLNGKVAEINAAFGLLQLKRVDAAIARCVARPWTPTTGRRWPKSSGVHCLDDAGEAVANYAYFPILIDADYPLSARCPPRRS